MAIDVGDVNTRIRFLLGGLPQTTLSDDVLNYIIADTITKYGDEDDNLCIITYQALLSALQYLIRGQAIGTGINNSNLKRRKETVGKRTIEVEAFDSTSSEINSYQDLYDYFIANPDQVCDSLIESDTKKTLVFIGGVSESEYKRVKCDRDSRNGWSASRDKLTGRRIRGRR